MNFLKRISYWLNSSKEDIFLAIILIAIAFIFPAKASAIPFFMLKTSKKKEKSRQEDIVRQERASAETRAAQARQEADTRASQIRAQQEAIAAPLGTELRTTVAPSPLETERQARLRALEPQQEQLLRSVLSGQAGTRAEDFGPLGSALQDRFLSDLMRPREIPYEETFQPAFNLLRQNVAQEASRRGLTGSGLELESLGRAGIDLAIKQAQERQYNRQINENLRQQAIANAMSGQQGLEEIGSSRRAEMSNYLRVLQTLEEARRAREISGLQGAALQPAQFRQTGNILGIEQAQSGSQLGSQLQEAGRGRTFGLESDILRNQIADRQRQNESVDRFLGQIPSIALQAAGAATGNPALIMAGQTLGGGGGGVFPGGFGTPPFNPYGFPGGFPGDLGTSPLTTSPGGAYRPNYQGISDFIEATARPGSVLNLNRAQQVPFASAERAASRQNSALRRSLGLNRGLF